MNTVFRWSVLVPLFVIPFLPLFVPNSFFFPFITGKGFAFRILIEAAAAAYLLLALAEPKYRPRFSWVLVLFTAFTAWMALADALALNPHKAFWSNYERMDGWVTLIHVFLFFVIAGSVLSADKLWKRWWQTFLTGAGLVSLYALLQLGGFATIHQGGVRVDATLGNATYLAAYVLFALAVTVWQIIESKGWMRYSLIALAVIEAWVLFATATRGVILGTVGAVLLGAFLWMFEAGKKGRKAAGIVLLALLVVVGTFFLVRGSDWVKSEPTLARIASISLSQGDTRFALWGMAFDAVKERPITGWGQEGFNYIFNKNYQPALYGQEAWFDRAHNVFVDWLVAGGVPALLLLIALLISAVIALYRSEVSRAERVLFISVLAAYTFQAMFVFDNLFTYVPLAAILAMAHFAASRPWKKVESLPTPAPGMRDTVLAPVALVIAVAVIWVVNIPSMVAASDLIQALSTNSASQSETLFKKTVADGSFATQEIREQMLLHLPSIVAASGSDLSGAQAFASYSLEEFGKEVAAAPEDARLHLEYAMAYRTVGDFPDALAENDKALALSPKKQGILVERGVELWQSDNIPAARAAFYQAYDLDRSFPELAAYAAAGDILAGDNKTGRALLLSAFGTTTVNNGLLISAYYQTKQYPDLINALEQRVRESDSATTRLQLATALASISRFAEAHALLVETEKRYPEAKAQVEALLAQFPPAYR